MKWILCQPATPRFQWELDVLLTNIRQFTQDEVILLFTENNFSVPLHFQKQGCSVFTFQDKRSFNLYIPSVRPWLLWQWLAQDPARERETYFYIDGDVIFRELPHFATLGFAPNKVLGSDCSGYLDANYVLGCENGEKILSKMAEICESDLEAMKKVPGIGAHIILDQPKAAFWERAYNDSNKIYIYFNGLTSDIQKWTAEMWAQLWGWVREGYTIEAPKELDFIRPTDPVGEWDKVKILHNAGVTPQMEGYFRKSDWTAGPPWGADFSGIDKTKATIKYVEAIQKVLH